MHAHEYFVNLQMVTQVCFRWMLPMLSKVVRSDPRGMKLAVCTCDVVRGFLGQVHDGSGLAPENGCW